MVLLSKYIVVTGGVVSSIGKGITAASIGRILRSYGVDVTAIKIDPYLNWDSGTLNPYQHGEVFVTEDGMETDLDLGHYERFLDVNLSEDYHYKKEAHLNMKKLFDTTNVNGYVNCLCVFDRMYCCKNENGDEASKDGSKYRGHGVIQLTWKEDYRKFTEYYQNKFNDYSVNFVTNPELLTTNFKYSVLAAMWEACKQKKLNTYADNDDVLSYSRGINLGDPNSTKTPNGKTKRENNLKSAKKTLCLNF